MRRIGLWIALAVLFVSLAMPAMADGPDGDVVIWGDNYTLESGQRIRGELLVYGGNVKIKENSQIDGDVTVFGGNLTLSGEVDGDVTVWGGNVNIKSEATVRGQVVSVGGTVNREEGADVRGSEIEGLPFPLPRAPMPPLPPRIPHIGRHSPWGSDFLRGVVNVFRSAVGVLVMVVLGILVVAFLPRHTETVAETMVKAPWHSLAIGAAASIAVPVGATVLAVTICLIPVSASVLLVAGIALLLGWIAAGLLLGVKVLRALTRKDPNHVAAVAVGILLLAVISLIPCVGWAVTLIATVCGLGAVIYSLFGTRAYNELAPSAAGSQPSGYDPRMDRM
ncbi:MAG: polymer-forming cytoskeletal protein [Promethearchaeota archaeon]